MMRGGNKDIDDDEDDDEDDNVCVWGGGVDVYSLLIHTY